jgi:tRNA nucleotidyltransferase (CCA-adding enzyme)
VGGKDLQAMGLPPSPAYGKILETVLEAKLNGKVRSREDEINLLRRHAARY